MSTQRTSIQYAFSTGIVSPGIFSRKDWERIGNAVADAKNGTIGQSGGFHKRPGTRYIGECLSHTKPIRQVTFKFSTDQVYELEFGDHEMRFYINGGIILTDDNKPYVLETPYSAEQAQEFCFAQERDTMIFAHWDLPLRRLTRHAHNKWAWDYPIEDKGRIAGPTGLWFNGADGDGHNNYAYIVSAYKKSGANIEESVTNPSLTSIAETAFTGGEQPQMTIAACKNWIKKYQGKYGSYPGFPAYPTALSPRDLLSTTRLQFNLYESSSGSGNHHGTLTIPTQWRKIWGAIPGINDTTKAGMWSDHDKNYVEVYLTTSRTTLLWSMYLDEGDDPNNDLYRLLADYLESKIEGGLVVNGQSKTTVYNSIITWINNNATKKTTKLAWNKVTGATGYYVYGRQIDSEDPKYYRVADVTTTTWEEENVWSTQPESFFPIESILSFTTVNNYPNLVTFFQQRLVLGCTKNKPTTIFGSKTGQYENFEINASDPSSGYEFKMASTESNPLEAILPLHTLVILTSGGDFVSTVTGAMNASNVNFNQKSYNGCSTVPPIILGDSGLYVALNQQIINSMSYSYERDGFKHDNILFFAGSLVKDKKIIGLAYQRAPIDLIWALLDDGTLLSCTYIPSQQFCSWTRHETDGKVKSINTVPTTEGNDELYMVVERTLGNGATRQYLEVLEDMRPYKNTPTAADAFFVDCGLTGIFDEPTATITELEHLEGREVICLADYGVERHTVQDGQITLDHPASAVHVGLPYEAVLETIDFEHMQGGTLRDTRRTISECLVEISDTRDLYVQCNDGAEVELAVHDGIHDMAEPMLQSGDCPVITKGAHTKGTRLRFRSPNPLPCNIISLVAQLDSGD